MFISLIRTIILYFLVLMTMRMMGKRQVGELEPFELTITIMISEIASLPMQDMRIPLVRGVIPIITLLILEILISIVQLKSRHMRQILTGKPSILISNGKLDIKQLKEQQYDVNDLLEELRLNGYLNISDIQYAILETSGQVSIIPKSDSTPTTRKDLKIKQDEEKLPVMLIMDGKVNYDNLKFINKSPSWLKTKLNENQIQSPDKLYIAMLDSSNNFFYQYKKGEKS